MSARQVELVTFSVIGLLAIFGLVQAVRTRSTWVAAMVVLVVVSGLVVWFTAHGTTFTGV